MKFLIKNVFLKFKLTGYLALPTFGRVKLARDVARMGETRNTLRFWLGKV